MLSFLKLIICASSVSVAANHVFGDVAVKDNFVISTQWHPEITTVNICLESNNIDVDDYLILMACYSINRFVTNDQDSIVFLNYLGKARDFKQQCDSFIFLKDDADTHNGFMERQYWSDPYSHLSFYTGGDVTLNVCKLQSSASFYNVLLHELLHLVGLQHRVPRDEAEAISYAVQKNALGNTIFDDRYINLGKGDIIDIQFIFRRDFPERRLPNPIVVNQYVPFSSPNLHVSGNDVNYDEFSRCGIGKHDFENDFENLISKSNKRFSRDSFSQFDSMP